MILEFLYICINIYILIYIYIRIIFRTCDMACSGLAMAASKVGT